MSGVRRLAVTLGDRYGVGPELVARLTEAVALPADVAGIVVGDPDVWEAGRAVAGVPGLPRTPRFEAAPTGWSFLARPYALEVMPMGRVSAEAGREVLETLGSFAEAAREGMIDAILYAPLNKQAMKAAGHAAGDELEFFRIRLPALGLTGEINVLGDLWTSRVTSHVPLREVGDLITIESVGRGIDLLWDTLRRAGTTAPRLAIAALNPHAGEGGAFGREEIDALSPAIAAARQRGIHAEGPFPSDTVFPRALRGDFEGIVTMFHDQGQIALKLLGLGEGITVLAGFPVPIATPAHGTAYDIAGTGSAKPDGLFAAARLALAMMDKP